MSLWSLLQNRDLWMSGDQYIVVYVHLTVGPVDLQTNSVFISLVLECIHN